MSIAALTLLAVKGPKTTIQVQLPIEPVRYQDLYRTGDTLSATLARLTAPKRVSFPAGLFEIVDFTDGGGKQGVLLPEACLGLLGAGIDETVFELKPGSSTRTSLVPAQATGASNPLNMIRTATGVPGFVASGFTLKGTDQGHPYNGLCLDHLPNPRLTEIKVVGVPGSANQPPGETFGINDFGCTDLIGIRIEVDGRNDAGHKVGAAPWGSNSSQRVTLVDVYVHDALTSTVTFWQTVGITTVRLRSEDNGSGPGLLSGYGINHERCTGPIRHTQPTLVLDRSTGNTGLHMTLNNDQANDPDVIVAEPTFSPGPVNGCFSLMIGKTYRGVPNKQTTLPKIVKNGVSLVPLTSGTNADPTKNYIRHS